LRDPQSVLCHLACRAGKRRTPPRTASRFDPPSRGGSLRARKPSPKDGVCA
jgi:hypothetical protein